MAAALAKRSSGRTSRARFDDVRQRLGDVGSHLLQRGVLAIADAGEDLAGVAAQEGAGSGERLVDQHPEREQVRAPVHGRARHLLGGHVRGRAHRHALRGEGLQAHVLGHAEVHQLHVAGLGEHHVGRLEVAVDDVAEVGVLERAGDARPDGGAHLGRQRPLLDELVQGGPVHELHHHEEDVVLLHQVVQGDDVLVAEGGERERLAAEARHGLLVAHGVREHLLDGDLALQHLVQPPVHLGHASAPQLSEHAVGAYLPMSDNGLLTGRHGREATDLPARRRPARSADSQAVEVPVHEKAEPPTWRSRYDRAP